METLAVSQAGLLDNFGNAMKLIDFLGKLKDVIDFQRAKEALDAFLAIGAESTLKGKILAAVAFAKLAAVATPGTDADDKFAAALDKIIGDGALIDMLEKLVRTIGSLVGASGDWARQLTIDTAQLAAGEAGVTQQQVEAMGLDWLTFLTIALRIAEMIARIASDGFRVWPGSAS